MDRSGSERRGRSFSRPSGIMDLSQKSFNSKPIGIMDLSQAPIQRQRSQAGSFTVQRDAGSSRSLPRPHSPDDYDGDAPSSWSPGVSGLSITERQVAARWQRSASGTAEADEEEAPLGGLQQVGVWGVCALCSCTVQLRRRFAC